MQKVIEIETSAKAGLLLALTAMGITPTNTEDKNGVTEITVDLTDDQENTLKAAFNSADATVGMIIRDSVGRVAEVVTDIVDETATGVVVPVLSIGAKVAAGGVRIGVKAAAQAGASIINNTVSEGARAVADIKANDECQKLKQSWTTVKAGMASLFAKKPKIKIS